MTYAERLKALLEDPDKIDAPGLLADLQQFENDHHAFKTAASQVEQDYQERILRLQENNRALIKQIPVSSAELPSKEEDTTMSWGDLAKSILKNVKGE